eukprot:Hpha_TRINITY_DN15122_c1_g1::TRINITY_DN15122_c1_g1_i10::g.129606::m.129606
MNASSKNLGAKKSSSTFGLSVGGSTINGSGSGNEATRVAQELGAELNASSSVSHITPVPRQGSQRLSADRSPIKRAPSVPTPKKKTVESPPKPVEPPPAPAPAAVPLTPPEPDAQTPPEPPALSVWQVVLQRGQEESKERDGRFAGIRQVILAKNADLRRRLEANYRNKAKIDSTACKLAQGDVEGKGARYQRVKDGLKSALKSAGIVCEVKEGQGELNETYRLQGNLDMYTDQAKAKRQKNRSNGEVMAALGDWWDAMPKTVEGALNKDMYKWMSNKLFQAFVPYSDEAEREMCIKEDWKNDSQGEKLMSRGMFEAAMFNFADIWCETTDAREYRDLLRACLQICLQPPGYIPSASEQRSKRKRRKRWRAERERKERRRMQQHDDAPPSIRDVDLRPGAPVDDFTDAYLRAMGGGADSDDDSDDDDGDNRHGQPSRGGRGGTGGPGGYERDRRGSRGGNDPSSPAGGGPRGTRGTDGGRAGVSRGGAATGDRRSSRGVASPGGGQRRTSQESRNGRSPGPGRPLPGRSPAQSSIAARTPPGETLDRRSSQGSRAGRTPAADARRGSDPRRTSQSREGRGPNAERKNSDPLSSGRGAERKNSDPQSSRDRDGGRGGGRDGGGFRDGRDRDGGRDGGGGRDGRDRDGVRDGGRDGGGFRDGRDRDGGRDGGGGRDGRDRDGGRDGGRD